MNIAKFLTKAFFAGIVFSFGAYFAITVLFPATGVIDASNFYEAHIADIEGQIGKSCIDVHADAISFMESDINQIIETGLAGDDWVAVITSEQKEFIDFNDEWLFDCSLARDSAIELGYEWPEFKELEQLYSALSIHSTSYSSRPATADRLNPQAFEDVQYYYRNVSN